VLIPWRLEAETITAGMAVPLRFGLSWPSACCQGPGPGSTRSPGLPTMVPGLPGRGLPGEGPGGLCREVHWFPVSAPWRQGRVPDAIAQRL